MKFISECLILQSPVRARSSRTPPRRLTRCPWSAPSSRCSPSPGSPSPATRSRSMTGPAPAPSRAPRPTPAPPPWGAAWCTTWAWPRCWPPPSRTRRCSPAGWRSRARSTASSRRPCTAQTRTSPGPGGSPRPGQHTGVSGCFHKCNVKCPLLYLRLFVTRDCVSPDIYYFLQIYFLWWSRVWQRVSPSLTCDRIVSPLFSQNTGDHYVPPSDWSEVLRHASHW